MPSCKVPWSCWWTLESPVCFFAETFQREEDLENACLVGQVQGESCEDEKYEVLSGMQPSKPKKILGLGRGNTKRSSITFLGEIQKYCTKFLILLLLFRSGSGLVTLAYFRAVCFSVSMRLLRWPEIGWGWSAQDFGSGTVT